MSRTITAGAVATASPGWADWLLPACTTIDAATGAVPWATMTTGLPGTPGAVARRVCVPTSGPSFQNPERAIPSASVTAFGVPTDPPPSPIEKVTEYPLTGFPLASVTRTDGGFTTNVFTGADCP